MKVYDAATIRNVALVGHTGSGKTQLASAILSDAGMVNRFGKVDDGTTVTDFDEEEIARKHTLSASLAYAEWNKHKINLIDTPGIGNFLSDARAALHVADAAARRGRRRLRRRWCRPRRCGRRPRSSACRGWSCSTGSIASAPASSARSQSLREACNRTVIPIQLPIGEEKIVQGRRRSRHEEGLHLSDRRAAASSPRATIPADMTGAVDAAREALIEMVAEADEKLMEKFFEAGTLTDDELVAGPAQRDDRRPRSFRCVCTSALAEHRHPAAARRDPRVPALARRAAVQGRSTRSATRSGARGRRESAGVGVRLEDHRRSVRRPHHDVPRRVGHAQGRLDRAQQDARTSPERLGHLVLLQGKTQTTVPEIKAGDLGAVAKLKDTLTNDTLGDKADPITFPPIKFPEPVLSYAIEPKTPRRRGQDQHVDAPARGRGSVHPLQPRSADQGAAARRARGSCTSRSPSRS